MNQNSGCGLDSEYVWAWDECEHQTPPIVCAAEGGTCECIGTIYYGRRYDTDGTTELTTLAAMQQFLTFNQTTTTSLPLSLIHI